MNINCEASEDSIYILNSPKKTVENKKANEIILDENYIIEQTLYEHSGFRIVYKVTDMRCKQTMALKLFLPNNSEDFYKEKQAHELLMDHPNIGKATLIKADYPTKVPYIYQGSPYEKYSYLLTPFCKNGTLYSALTKANSAGKKFSTELS
jgi:serine/threonine protein kinase